MAPARKYVDAREQHDAALKRSSKYYYNTSRAKIIVPYNLNKNIRKKRKNEFLKTIQTLVNENLDGIDLDKMEGEIEKIVKIISDCF